MADKLIFGGYYTRFVPVRGTVVDDSGKPRETWVVEEGGLDWPLAWDVPDEGFDCSQVIAMCEEAGIPFKFGRLFSLSGSADRLGDFGYMVNAHRVGVYVYPDFREKAEKLLRRRLH